MNENLDVLNMALVDDDVEDQELFADAFYELSLPHRITLYDDCLQLIEDIEKKNVCYDLIFLDLVMPVINGQECLKMLKSHELCKSIPVIIHSVSNLKAEIDVVYDLGAHFHVVKPYALLNMKEALKDILSRSWKPVPTIPPRNSFVINRTFS